MKRTFVIKKFLLLLFFSLYTVFAYSENIHLDALINIGVGVYGYNKEMIIYSAVIVGILSFMIAMLFNLFLHRRIKTTLRKNQLISAELNKKNIELAMAMRAGMLIPFHFNFQDNKIVISINDADKRDCSDILESLNGKTLNEISKNIHPNDVEAYTKFSDSMRHGTIDKGRLEMRYDEKGLFENYYEVYLIKNRYDEVKTDEFIGYIQNITSRKMMEKAQKRKESYLKYILDQIPIPIHIKDIENEGRYVYWNEASTKLLGSSFYNNKVEDVVVSSEARIIDEIDNQVYLTEKPYSGFETIHTLDGRMLETIVYKNAIVDRGKKKILITRWDVSEQNRLQQKAKILDLSISHIQAYTWYFNSEEDIISYGDGLRELGGNPESLNTFLKISNSIHENDREKFLKTIRIIMKMESGNFNFSFRIKHRDNEEFQWWECRGTVEQIVKKDTNYQHIMGLNINVNEHYKMADELRKAKEKAEQSDKLKSSFLANMSHEIRTPLNAIVGFSDLLTQTETDEEKEMYIKIIKNNSDYLLTLISDILDLSKIEAGVLESKRVKFNISDVCSDLYSIIENKLAGSDIELIIDNPYKECIVNLDVNRLKQVWINFLNNAVKCTHNGHIKLGYNIQEEGIKIYVEDTGIGIPENKRQQIFNRFEKLNSFAPGTGLGLSICKAIIENANGTIGVDSEHGEGSTFWAYIPCDVDITKN